MHNTAALVHEKFAADIICLQETKLSKVDMTHFQNLAVSEGW